MKCGPCTIAYDSLVTDPLTLEENIPNAITEVAGTLLCIDCARNYRGPRLEKRPPERTV